MQFFYDKFGHICKLVSDSHSVEWLVWCLVAVYTALMIIKFSRALSAPYIDHTTRRRLANIRVYTVVAVPMLMISGWIFSISSHSHYIENASALIISTIIVILTASLHHKAAGHIKLATSQQLHATLVDGSPSPMMLFDCSGQCLAVNKAGLEAMAWDSAEPTTHMFAELWSEDSSDTAREAFQQVISGLFSSFRTEHVSSDGNKSTWHVSLTPVPDEDSAVRHFTGLCTDITEQLRYSAMQKLNESRLEALLKLSQMTDASLQDLADFALEEGVRLTGSTVGYLAFVSEDESMLEMHSWSQSALEMCKIAEKQTVYPVESTGIWGEAIRQREPVIINDYHKNNPLAKGYPAGHIPLTRHLHIPIFDGDNIVAVAGVGNKSEDYNDFDLLHLTIIMSGMWRILKNRQAEDALRESETNYRSIFDAANDAFFIHDAATGVILDVNSKMCEMFGCTAEEAHSLDVTAASEGDPGQVRENAYERIRKAVQGEPQLFEWLAKDRNGREFWVEVNLKLATIGGNDRILAVVRDISERKRVEEQLRETNQALKALVESAPLSILSLTTEGLVTIWNPAAEKMLGWTQEEVLGKFIPTVSEDKREEACGLMQRVVQGESFTDVHVSRRKKDGTSIDLSLSVAPLYDSQGKVNGIMSVMSDITDRKKTEEALKLQTSALNAVSDQIIITDLNGKVEFVNPAFEKDTGFSLEEVVGKDSRLIRSGCFDERIYNAIVDTVKSGRTWHGETTNKRKDGSSSIDDLTITPVINDDGVIEHLVTVKRNITEKKVYQEKLDHLAHHDPLTGLPNRLLFGDRLIHQLAESKRNEEMLAVMFLDLDRFKLINDTLGHNIGDELLKEVSKRLTASLREVDTIARMGGDEFTIILSHIMAEHDAQLVADKIHGTLSRPFMLGGRELFVTASIGISIYPNHGTNAETLVRNADTAMYKAKELGRNTYQLYTDSLNAAALEKMNMEHYLRKAIEREEFILHYQPRVNIKTGQVLGAEALIRWQHPELGLVSPLDFIPLAEETGLIVPISEWVMRTACIQNKTWQDSGLKPISIAINVSPREFQSDVLTGMVDRVLKESGMNPAYLDLELTESTLMQNPDCAEETLSAIKSMGARISVDDFGTGYSSLSYLKRFPIDMVKIDQSFVKDITTNPDDAAIAGAVVAMAHSLKLSVIAEGVETLEQLQFLRSINCDEMQGYFISRPVPAEELEQILRDTSLSVPSDAYAA